MKLIGKAELAAKGIKLTKSTLHRKMRDGDFPKAVLVGNRCSWVESEVDDYIKSLLAKRDASSEAA